jgi:hypothetical protein
MCWCVDVLMLCNFVWVILKTSKDEGGDYDCEDLHEACNFEIIASLHAHQRLCGYLKNITPNSIMITSHWPFAKLLSFKTYTEDGIRVIGVHTCKI